MRILVISGSRRERAYSGALAGIAYHYAKERYGDVDLLDLAIAPLEGFRGFEAPYGLETREIVRRVSDADVFIICSPVYNGLLSSGIKNLFEFVDYKALEGRVAGFAVMASGRISYLQVQGQLQALMNYFRVVSNPRAAYVNQGDFDQELNLVNQAMLARLKGLVDETVEMGRR